MDLILKYFPELTQQQLQRFEKMQALYEEWNNRINVISRKDMAYFYERHVLHSLGIAKVIQFKPGTKVMDVGTGGGFPGIPLAVMFPQCHFVLVDSIGKKVKVVNEVSRELGLVNVQGINERAEKVKEKFDFVISRAVTTFPDFYKWVKSSFSKEHKNELPNGILYLKGGDLLEEFGVYYNKTRLYELRNFFEEDFFDTKKVAYYPV